MWAYPPTRRQLAATIGVFAAGATLIAVGVHLSFANVASQQARAKARSEFVRSRLRKFLDD
ncbi:uncharacterized protein LOC104426057 [Eucalyptus grandis]|uniref:uncharacterized protein LOC104426057 n=1 Tax=Eucalyptus grandis TaxID=71139 RepID=UPI0008A0E589|nr:uncharacterized protein LOC104426057 [Eucalyptus grandis]XP_018720168.1 uncharacterized protein LOC104426057 [Eucalyptus grandis]XP_039161456.1 uncharacterized protein LOC104426057 [Eucalyptus grandis]XP_039161457.1 uncharacterized protein LOC104426057 [Eucalyptus grandis]